MRTFLERGGESSSRAPESFFPKNAGRSSTRNFACFGSRLIRPQAGNYPLCSIGSRVAQWNEIGGRPIAIAQDLPQNKYEYKPNPQSRSFVQQLVHAAGSMYYFTDVAQGKQARYGDDPPRSEWVTKDDVVALVSRCVKDGADVLAAKGDSVLNEAVNDGSPHLVRLADLAYRIIEHSGEHYGQLVAYYRINGMVPPESRRK